MCKLSALAIQVAGTGTQYGYAPAVPCRRVSAARTALGPAPRSRRGRPGRRAGAPYDARWAAAAAAVEERLPRDFFRKIFEPKI